MSVSVRREQLKLALEAAYADFHVGFHRERDPVHLAHRYSSQKDQEIAGFFAALLAYGNVTSIINSVKEILMVLGENPHEFLLREKNLIGRWPGFVHRFTTEEDLEIVAAWLHQALNRAGSLENFFISTSLPLNSPMQVLLSDFVKRLKALPLPRGFEEKLARRSRNLKYLISDPFQGSACKRLNMYLRWMVRPADGIDLGLWTKIAPHQLLLPIDTHLLQTLHRLRWTKSKQATWKVAEEATKRLKEFCPEDPVRFDFALCHMSMSGSHIGQYREKVKNAPME